MKWAEGFNLIISLLAVAGSIYSIYKTDQNKQKQQELEREMQNNEFRFSRRKVWYDKQNEVVDTSLTKLIEISSKADELFEVVMKEIDPRNNQTKVFVNEVTEIKKVIHRNNNYLKANSHYFPKELFERINSLVISNEQFLEKIDPKIRILYSLKEAEIDKIIEGISLSVKDITIEIRNIFLD